jgi:catechol 2,3-dioxygenase-like lactoylglutathione lyase family enzyme
MAYARIEVPDLQDSIGFFEYHVGLQLEGHDQTYAHMRCGIEHHCLDLVAAPDRDVAEVTAIGLTVESEEVLEDIKTRLVADGREILELSERIAPWVTSGFSVKDPNGLILELVYEFQVYAEPPLLEWRPLDIVHPFLSTPYYEECQHFYLDVLGFLASDYIVSDGRGASSFIRSEDRYHHSWALRRDDRFYVAHIAFMMKSLDHVMRGRARAIYKGINIPSDIVNHSASRSIAFYMQEPQHGPRFELMDGHRVFTLEEHENAKPRKMSADPRNIDVWRAAADDWERF